MNYTIEQLCQFTGFSFSELATRSRNHEKVYARYVIIDYILKRDKISLEKCSRIFFRDHSTAIHGVKELNNPHNTVAVKMKELFKANMHLDREKGKEEDLSFIYESLIEEYHG